MLLIDANIALRYILNDDKEQAQRVKDIIDDNYIEMPIEVLSEVVYNLVFFTKNLSFRLALLLRGAWQVVKFFPKLPRLPSLYAAHLLFCSLLNLVWKL